MEKQISILLKHLKTELISLWILQILLFAAGETNILPNGVYAGDAQTEYALDCTGVLLMLIVVPLALRLFNLNTTRGIKRMNLDEAITEYHKWSIVRIVLLAISNFANTVFYYFTLNTANLLCIFIGLVALFMCWPTYNKIKDYLELTNKQNEQ